MMVYGAAVLSLTPPSPVFMLMASSDAFSGTAQPFTLMLVTPMKYSSYLSPWKWLSAETGLTSSGV